MQIYNTMSRKKEEFVPVEAGKLKLYACGPTVYNYFHIGNARAFIFFDVVRRYFEYLGYDVTYVQNITDIDDKIITQSIDENKDFSTIADKYSNAFLEDCQRLGIKTPHYQPRATEVMDDIIRIIDAQVKSGHAYESGGDVYFDAESLPAYGSLSGKKIEDQMAGARVEENKLKRNPADFTLWKKSKPGEPFWPSPWGEGRPGWHSECVVMSQKYLGETFDIHGGGIDLVFPHHENELAQALATTGKPLANYWMHNGFLNIEGEKMSKSLNNFFTARDILEQHSAEAIRFFFLSKHYRSPIDFNREIIAESERAIGSIYQTLKTLISESAKSPEELMKIQVQSPALLSELETFKSAMDDDFNTARAIAVFFDLSRLIKNKNNDLSEREEAAALLLQSGTALGFFGDLKALEETPMPDLSRQLIELIIGYRANARTDKNWALSDQIRDDLAGLGIELKDSKEGCTWTIKG
ncbi:MAG: cysteine--tRNA ligase [Candidatus Cloacimonadota bacterium]